MLHPMTALTLPKFSLVNEAQDYMKFQRQTLTLSVFATLMLSACGGGDGGSVTADAPGPNGSYLFVDSSNYYFGTTDVGTVRTQSIELVNRGGDIYPIKSFAVSGDNREEFVSDFYGPVTLNPAEAIRLNVTFQPVSDGRKFADIEIDFDTIVQVTDKQNQNEQKYYEAKELERIQDYPAASNKYGEYIQTGPVVDVNKHRAAIKLPVIKESATYGDGKNFKDYLAAVNARENGDMNAALEQIDQVLISNSNTYIADDALYLKGYIELMDIQDYAAARKTMQQLRRLYPDSTYYDTALYSEALALKSLGNENLATEILLDLRYKHTGIDSLGITLPKDNIVSRMWFDRANNVLETMGSI